MAEALFSYVLFSKEDLKLSFGFENAKFRVQILYFGKKIPSPENLALLQNYGFELNLKFDVETSDHLVSPLSCGDLDNFGQCKVAQKIDSLCRQTPTRCAV